MKKIYKAPTTNTYKIEVRHIFCGSDPNSLADTMGYDATDSNDEDNNLSKDEIYGW